MDAHGGDAQNPFLRCRGFALVEVLPQSTNPCHFILTPFAIIRFVVHHARSPNPYHFILSLALPTCPLHTCTYILAHTCVHHKYYYIHTCAIHTCPLHACTYLRAPLSAEHPSLLTCQNIEVGDGDAHTHLHFVLNMTIRL